MRSVAVLVPGVRTCTLRYVTAAPPCGLASKKELRLGPRPIRLIHRTNRNLRPSAIATSLGVARCITSSSLKKKSDHSQDAASNAGENAQIGLENNVGHHATSSTGDVPVSQADLQALNSEIAGFIGSLGDPDFDIQEDNSLAPSPAGQPYLTDRRGEDNAPRAGRRDAGRNADSSIRRTAGEREIEPSARQVDATGGRTRQRSWRLTLADDPNTLSTSDAADEHEAQRGARPGTPMARSIEGGSGNFSEQDLTNFILEQQQTLEQQEDDRPSSRVEGRRRADQCTSTSQSSKDDKVVAQDTLQSGVAPTGVTFSGVEAESKDENCASDASVDSMPYTYEFGARRSASGMMSVLVLNGPACFVGGRLASTGEPQRHVLEAMKRTAEALDLSLTICTSNREDKLLDQLCTGEYDAIVYNPAGSRNTISAAPPLRGLHNTNKGGAEAMHDATWSQHDDTPRSPTTGHDQGHRVAHERTNSALSYALARTGCPVIEVRPHDALSGTRGVVRSKGRATHDGSDSNDQRRGVISGFSGVTSYKLAMAAVASTLEEREF